MSIQEGTVTLTGNLGADPVSFGRDPNNQGCSFNVGVSPSYFDQSSHSWKSRDTVWVKVRAFRTLATNALQSLRKGDAVIVSGALRVDKWTKDGVDRMAPVVEANIIGHDLNCGTAAFRRAKLGQFNTSGAGQELSQSVGNAQDSMPQGEQESGVSSADMLSDEAIGNDPFTCNSERADAAETAKTANEPEF